jgi:alpha-galactosidase
VNDSVVVDVGGGFGTGVRLARLADGRSAIGCFGAVGPGPRGIDTPTDASPAEVFSGHSRWLPVVPGQADGWLGRPGLRGHRLGGDPPAGRDWSPSFAQTDLQRTDRGARASASDPEAGLELRTEVEALDGGALRMRHQLTNTGTDGYLLEELAVTVPVPHRAVEVLDFTGRHLRERVPQRRPIADGVWLREGRGGRPGFDSPTLLVAGTDGFGFRCGEVWAVHLAWSGNGRYALERGPTGSVTLVAGELLLPGEVVLGDGESYKSPWVHLVASTAGLDGITGQLLRYQRSLRAHPNVVPVVCNSWEAVYFDHDLARLGELAERAAAVGAERFVLDDGWFGARRDDRAGLGDWTVSADAWPQGLDPLIDRVHALGMDFGLWIEPEMVNPDSQLYRTHPDWILGTGGRVPLLVRNQLVLDVSRPEVREHLLEVIGAVLARYRVDYVKWDHNRPLVDAGTLARYGVPVVHEQTLGYYTLLDQLRARFPAIAWESCASGGGRIDLAVLERVARVWTSDLTDPLGRQAIQRWTGLLVAPEYLGAHVCAPTNHQTGRASSLDFRAATAFFAALGIEWDLTTADENELRRLRGWVSLYKRHRGLLHSADTVRVDVPEPAVWIHGVVSPERDEAVFCYVQRDDALAAPPFRLAGLDPARRYRVQALSPADDRVLVDAAGAALHDGALPAPPRGPQRADLIHVGAL